MIYIPIVFCSLTVHLAVSVGLSVGPSVGHISEFRAVFAVLLLPDRPRLDCRVSGLVEYADQGRPNSNAVLDADLWEWAGMRVSTHINSSKTPVY